MILNCLVFMNVLVSIRSDSYKTFQRTIFYVTTHQTDGYVRNSVFNL